MNDINSYGKTILLVSHDTKNLVNICSHAILLRNGRIEEVGPALEVTMKYLQSNSRIEAIKSWGDSTLYPGDDIVRLLCVKAIDKSGNVADMFKVTEPIGIQMEYEVLQEGSILWQGFNFYNSEGTNIFDSHNINSAWYNKPHPVGKFIATAWIPSNLLAEDTILVGCAIFNHIDHKVYFHEKRVISFDVYDSGSGDSSKGVCVGKFPGIIRPLLNWETSRL